MKSPYIVDLHNHFSGVRDQNLWDLITEYGFDSLTFDIRQVSMSDIDYCYSKGITPVGMLDPIGWFGLHGAAAADKMDQILNDLGFKGTNATKPFPVMFDYEWHSIQEVIDLISRWRFLRWKRYTYITMEPLQDWWTDTRIVALVNTDHGDGLVIVPECYRGPDNVDKEQMMPVAHDACREHMEADGRGFSNARIKLFYGVFWRDKLGNDHYLPIPEAADGFFWVAEKIPYPKP